MRSLVFWVGVEREERREGSEKRREEVERGERAMPMDASLSFSSLSSRAQHSLSRIRAFAEALTEA
jgi:hypothetical protein